eukprot:6645883-Heterocapsa_arctica.AAC.1
MLVTNVFMDASWLTALNGLPTYQFQDVSLKALQLDAMVTVSHLALPIRWHIMVCIDALFVTLFA